jgi:hypothetical protein
MRKKGQNDFLLTGRFWPKAAGWVPVADLSSHFSLLGYLKRVTHFTVSICCQQNTSL